MTDNRNDLQPGNNNEYAEEGIEGRHRNPRAPRRRTAGINKEELQSIQNSIEQSLSVYEKADCKAEHYNKAYKPVNTEELLYSRKEENGACENSVTGADKNTAAGAADDIARSKSGKKKHPVLKMLMVIGLLYGGGIRRGFQKRKRRQGCAFGCQHSGKSGYGDRGDKACFNVSRYIYHDQQ